MDLLDSRSDFTMAGTKIREHSMLPSSTVVIILRTLMISAIASFAAIIYSELLFLGTRAMYRKGWLLRYFPLPQERHAFTAWISAFGFIAPTALFAAFNQANLERSWELKPLSLLVHAAAYVTMHDVYFYLVHSNFHRLRPLYDMFHAMHHEYAYAMNCYIVGYAEVVENIIQVGVPWIAWTYLASGNWWNWLLPMSLIVFTTLVGHSGYRMSLPIAIFHPLIMPFVLVGGKYMLTPGDHQMHHSHRRCNYGLFWKTMDTWHGTYRKCDHKPHDIVFWSEWAAKKDENSDDAKKWLGRHAVQFEEVSWGL